MLVHKDNESDSNYWKYKVLIQLMNSLSQGSVLLGRVLFCNHLNKVDNILSSPLNNYDLCVNTIEREFIWLP